MSFKRDADYGQKAVDIVLNYLIDQGYTAHELEGVKEQKHGDVRYYEPMGKFLDPIDVEVKYDMMSLKTNNLCFELSNPKGLTGIMKTKSHKVMYVCPTSIGHSVYVFNTNKLKRYISRPNNSGVIIKNGGDRRKFKLALVSLTTVSKEKFDIGLKEIWIIDAQL